MTREPASHFALKVRVTDKFIRVWRSEDSSATYSVHDFIRGHKIPLGIHSHVHYVGITKNPQDRPINREHRGIADVLHNISNEANDFFLFVNTFKVLARHTETQGSVSLQQMQ